MLGIGAALALCGPSLAADAVPSIMSFLALDLGIPGVTLDDKGITVQSPDEAAKFRIGGRPQLADIAEFRLQLYW